MNEKRPSQPITENGWGVACWRCGHPASYHGVTFCQVWPGAANKRQCDCPGYSLGPDAKPPSEHDGAPYTSPNNPYGPPRFDPSKCPCNPALGGSGVCGCILGGPTITCSVEALNVYRSGPPGPATKGSL